MRRDGQPARVVRALVFEAAGQEALVVTVGVHDPNARHPAGLGAAEDDPTAIGRLAGAEIPNWRSGAGQRHQGTVAGFQAADLHAAAGLLGFEIAVEMVGVRALRLILQSDFGAGHLPRKQDVTVVRPAGDIGTAAAVFGVVHKWPRTTWPGLG